MDVLTHIFLPLTLVYVLRKDFKFKHFPLTLFTVLPDFDVFLGIHRGLFHSLLFLIPLAVLLLIVEYVLRRELKYSLLANFFLFFHIFLDFLAGGVPFLYPIIEKGVGIEFPFIIRFGQSISIVDVIPKIVYCYPKPVHGEANIFSQFGVVTTILFFLIYLRISKERRESK